MTPFCGSPHPDPKHTAHRLVNMLGWVSKSARPMPFVFCMRQAGHDGDHAAFTFRISKHEAWPQTLDA
jgi:hypothetical protein